MDELRIGQLTKEMIAEELRRMGDPCAAAAALVKKTLGAALSGPNKAGAERVIEDTVKGALTALLLADQSITRGSLLMLETVLEVANECSIDPTVSMRAALRAIADLRRFVEPQRLEDIRLSIDAQYMGAGDVFVEYIRQPIMRR